MNEIKSYKEIITSNMNKYITDFIGRVILSEDSIETYPLYMYCFDLLLVHLCGILEEKYRALQYIIAENDLDKRFELYSEKHNISVFIDVLFRDYKSEFSEEIKEIKSILNKNNVIDNNIECSEEKYEKFLYAIANSVFSKFGIGFKKFCKGTSSYKEFKKIICSINTNNKTQENVSNEEAAIVNLQVDFKEVFDFLINISDTYQLNNKLGSIFFEFSISSFFTKIENFKNDNSVKNGKNSYYKGIYNELIEIYKNAYNHRHTVAHNIQFGYKYSNMNFDLLKTTQSCNNLFAYLFVVMIADRIIKNIYKHIAMRQMI